MIEKPKPLWRCPKCGHRFVTRNLWHSCGRYRLADHFKGKDPRVRKLFDRFCELVQKYGPVTIYPQKTRIVCMVRVRFGGVVVMRDWLRVGLWLRRRAEHPTLLRIESYGPDSYGHYFRLNEVTEMDEAFVALVREAYAVGCQEHLRLPTK